MSEPLRVVIADDELLARKRLHRLCAALPGVEVVGELAGGEEVLERVRAGGVDVVLLDIQMPGLSGIDALQLWPDSGPHVIFCTAHPDHAVAAFDAGAVDYLLKPVEPARLAKALDRARLREAHRRFLAEVARRHEAPADASPQSTSSAAPGAPKIARLALPTRQGVVLLDPAIVTHAVLDGELVTVHTTQGDTVQTLAYSRLVLATGAQPIRVPVQGNASGRVRKTRSRWVWCRCRRVGSRGRSG